MNVSDQNGFYYNELKQRIEDFFCTMIIKEAQIQKKTATINEPAKEVIRAYGGAYYDLYTELKEFLSQTTKDPVAIDRKFIMGLDCFLSELDIEEVNGQKGPNRRQVREYMNNLNRAVIKIKNQKNRKRGKLGASIHTKLNVNLTEIGKEFAVKPQAITDRLRRYDKVIRELLLEEPDEWKPLRSSLTSIRKRDYSS